MAYALRTPARSTDVAATWTAFGCSVVTAFVALKGQIRHRIWDDHTPAAGTFYVYYLTITGIHLLPSSPDVSCSASPGFRLRAGRFPPGTTGFRDGGLLFRHLVDFCGCSSCSSSDQVTTMTQTAQNLKRAEPVSEPAHGRDLGLAARGDRADGMDPHHESRSDRWAMIAMLAVAAWKIRLVMTDFMELRHARSPGRLVFEGWAVLPVVLCRPALALTIGCGIRAGDVGMRADRQCNCTEHRFSY